MSTLNDQVEASGAGWYNEDITLLEGPMAIVSLESFLHGYHNQEEFEKYHTFYQDDEINKMIEKTPLIDNSFTLYKGISKRDIKVGQLLVPEEISSKFRVLFATLSKYDAEFYAYHDVSRCYPTINDREAGSFIDRRLAVPREEGLILKIRVPPRVHFFERTQLNIWTMSMDNEVIFSSKTRLLVESIGSDVIECLLFPFLI
jgi:hypothetical protein